MRLDEREKQLCVFHVGHMLMGISVERVREVLRPLSLTRTPLAPRWLSGLINVRGEVIPALDLRRLLGMRPYGDPMTNIILFTPPGVISALVDMVGSVVAVRDEWLEPCPLNLDASMRALCRTVYKVDTRLLLELDVGSLLTRVEGETAEVA